MHFPKRFQLKALLGCVLALFISTVAHAGEPDVRRVWQMLDYLAVDYAGAVKDGAVLSQSEFDEMREFAKASQAKPDVGAITSQPARR